MWNLHCRFDRYYIGQIYGGDFTKFCGLLRIYELYQTNIFLSASFCEIQFYIERLIFKVTFRDWSKMYSTQAIAKLEKNGKYEKITIGRGWTSEDDLDIDIKVTFMSPIAELTWVSTQG